jgi:hypothetical protein
MQLGTKVLIAGATVIALPCFLAFTDPGHKAQFVLGGAMINAGYRLQDHHDEYDFHEGHDEHHITPEAVWQEMLEQNRMAASVRSTFPRTPRHPLVAMVVCMDARIDTNELTGDTRKYYYVVRTAGSVLSEREMEMLELAVDNGVKVIVLTTHTDCAAERVAKSDELQKRYPALSQAVQERGIRIRELLARPAIASRLRDGSLAVKLMDIDTATERLEPK